ncbi:neural proliferation differentiation and control protein 1-like [Uloborus diversus]|uniref:neural proliferation differentiation and control protein 1-like n=1 Tax=Uloborus diversus TaxID=327109 RepID=UPI00240A0646|nr:neural proliferation differentiation and control protein 1-like [Uloborus diversus]
MFGIVHLGVACVFLVESLKGQRHPALAGSDIEQDLQDFVRRLTQQQMQTTQNLMLPRLQLPLMGLGEEGMPFQVPFSGGARSFASSSIKRPQGMGQAEAVAYASVKDVEREEHLGDSDVSDKSSSTVQAFYKKSPTPVESSADSSGSSSSQSGPFTLKHQQVQTVIKADDDSLSDVYFVAIVAGCCAVGIFGVISAGICFYRLQKSRKAAADVDYPAYGVTGPSKDLASSPPNGDRKLAQSAQMYHYQHQKQQMIAVEKAGSTKNASASDVDSEEENEEGDYTVYECPGLAPTGEMEVKNPLFHDDSTPVSPPVLPSKLENHQDN